MKNRKRFTAAFTAALIGAMSLGLVSCGSTSADTSSADTASADTAADASSSSADASSAADSDASASAGDLNSKSLDEITAAAKEEGDVESVGMPDNWADWGSLWKNLSDNYGITHTDADMSSAEELQMFSTEGENGTKDIGDVGMGFTKQVIDEDLTQGYKTSYWDSLPDWAKGEDGKWIIAYTGATTFLSNKTELDKDGQTVPTSWKDIENGTYKVSIGDINGGNAQAAIIASNFAMGGDLTNLDPAFEFWKKMAEAGRINTLDITEQNFETGEVPVGVVWSFTGIPYSKNITKYEMQATVPADGSIKSGYASVINKYAPHPNAAALAREVMLSDEGQSYIANAGGIPSRTDVQIEGYDPDTYKDCILMEDTDAYSKACEEVVSRWQEEITPLLVQ
ncbi:MAG: ABC transporter substrate-binding protein [Lachnospiraceae bacterium]|nr:ABC transporter substrate-binding protein [Lachnospiraceae bacterium]